MERGDLTPITAWLGDRLHRFGRLLTPERLLRNTMGADFDPLCYTAYLRKKFSALYRL